MKAVSMVDVLHLNFKYLYMKEILPEKGGKWGGSRRRPAKAKTKIGETVKLVYKLTQHSRDKELIKNIIKYLGCGGVFFQTKTSDIIHLLVTKFSYIQIKIIPFFKQHPVLGVKALDFQD